MTYMAKVKKGGIPKRVPEVTTKHGKLKTDRKCKPQPILFDDLAALDSLSEQIITDQLQKRYQLGQIYTYIGDILLAINPFKRLNIYEESVSSPVACP